MNLLKHIKVFGELKTPYTNYTPIPMDVTVMNNSGSNKEEVGRTYKGNDGFAPMNAYIGTHGYLLNCELRPGVQHSQKGMEEFLLQTIEMTDSLGIDNALHVLDSAHDAAVNIDFYHQQGTSEQFHSELKSDMNIERLPSGKFSTNSLLLQLAMIAYNCLRKLGQKALTFKDKLPVKLNVTRRRLRNVIQDLMYIACKRVSHANSIPR